MYIMIGILLIIIFIQAFLLWKYQRQVKDICRQLAFLLKHDSNMLITRDIDFGNIGKLADILNEYLTLKHREHAQYRKKEKIISDTYANLSHDIRTPLTSLDGYFQLLEDCSSADDRQRYLAVIRKRIESLKEMLEELFTFTKLKNETSPLELTHCCVTQILKETVFSYYEDWTKLGIEPEILIPKQRVYMPGNPPALRRIIQNVLKNAVEHGEKKIKITLHTEGEQILLAVSNKVPHPEQIDVAMIFERFYKADEARSKTSTGLGLAIAKELVLRMAGEIEAAITEDIFCITIRFPLTLPND
ncbi:HAMP domain-containing sensor histidine kinase [Lachnospiraceae bacterium 46-15]